MKILKYIIIPLLSIVLLSCSSTKKEDILGTWDGSTWDLTFNEDGTAEVYKNGNKLPGEVKYSIFINALEIVQNGRVFMSNITIKSIENDVLSLEFRELVGGGSSGTTIEKLHKIK